MLHSLMMPGGALLRARARACVVRCVLRFRAAHAATQCNCFVFSMHTATTTRQVAPDDRLLYFRGVVEINCVGSGFRSITRFAKVRGPGLGDGKGGGRY